MCCLLLLLSAAKLWSLGSYIVGQSALPYYVKQQDYGTYELESYEVEGVAFYYPVSGDRVGYDAFPAIPRKTDFAFRGESLRQGFCNSQ